MLVESVTFERFQLSITDLENFVRDQSFGFSFCSCSIPLIDGNLKFQIRVVHRLQLSFKFMLMGLPNDG